MGWSNFYQEIFVLDYFDIGWPNILICNEKKVNSTTNNFLYTMNSVLHNMSYLTKVNKYKHRLKKALDYFWYSKINLF